MPYSKIADLPQAVREALPPRAQRVFMAAFNNAQDSGSSEEKSFASAWGAIRNAGWKKSDSGGKWIKKAGYSFVGSGEVTSTTVTIDASHASAAVPEMLKHQPSASQVHVDAPMDGDKKKKPKRKPDDDPAMKSVEFSVEVKKLDEDQNLVFGWLSVIEENGEAVVDLQGHVIDEVTLEAAAYDMVLNGCDAGEMHERIGIGAGLVECMVFTKAKQEALGIDLGKVGLWVGFKVDEEAFAKVKSGDLRAFSLGGVAVLEDMPEAA